MKMIVTSECEECRYGVVDDSNKSKIVVTCQIKNKKYYYGQCIPCDFKERR